MEQIRPRSIKLVDFQEEALPSGRKLLHCIFKDNPGYYYKWTPPWKGEHGVERLFFKALEVEEHNEPEGVWTDELKKAAEQIPPLGAIQLPVRVSLGQVEQSPAEKEWPAGYELKVVILSGDCDVARVARDRFLIGDCIVHYDSLSDAIEEASVIPARKSLESIVLEFQGPEIGISFKVYIAEEQEHLEYGAIARRLSWKIRSYIRRVLSDFRALKQGFEES